MTSNISISEISLYQISANLVIHSYQYQSNEWLPAPGLSENLTGFPLTVSYIIFFMFILLSLWCPSYSKHKR